MVTTIEPMQEGIHPPVPIMERGVVMRVEVIREIESQGTPRETWMYMKVGLG